MCARTLPSTCMCSTEDMRRSTAAGSWCTHIGRPPAAPAGSAAVLRPANSAGSGADIMSAADIDEPGTPGRLGGKRGGGSAGAGAATRIRQLLPLLPGVSVSVSCCCAPFDNCAVARLAPGQIRAACWLPLEKCTPVCPLPDVCDAACCPPPEPRVPARPLKLWPPGTGRDARLPLLPASDMQLPASAGLHTALPPPLSNTCPEPLSA
mmetsp:Transcript_8412/g.25431  ORF Transcript_8412/g.25431 Transcript_8412/m.25431 type:complete len:208 (+) Transcript_8412:1041-1664(+)